MLIPLNKNPDDCIYNKATFVLKVLIEHKQLSTTELFYYVNQSCKMTYFVFILCLDWLYLIGTIHYTHDAHIQIKLCT